MRFDFTLHLPRFRGRFPSFSVVHAPRASLEPPLYCHRVQGGLEVRIGSKLIYAESRAERR